MVVKEKDESMMKVTSPSLSLIISFRQGFNMEDINSFQGSVSFFPKSRAIFCVLLNFYLLVQIQQQKH